MADATVSKTVEGNLMSVRLRPPAPTISPPIVPQRFAFKDKSALLPVCLVALRWESGVFLHATRLSRTSHRVSRSGKDKLMLKDKQV